MTETSAKPEKPEAPAGAIADFGIDTTSMSTGEAIKDYFARMKDGQLGSIPAVLGVIALAVLFSALSGDFFTLRNIANLLEQGAGQTIIAMGIVFVLLLGEIDLSAGTASGVCASLMALHYVRNGNLLGVMGTGVFITFIAVLVLAVVLALLQKIWAGAAVSLVGIVVILIGAPVNAWVEMVIAICTGTAIGCITGFLVSKIGMPSFVVTLALFIVWQGVILQFVGEGGTLPISTSDTLNAVANGNLSIVGSWVLFVVAAGGYAVLALGQHFSRLKRGLVVQPTPIVLAKVAAVAVLAAVATYLLTVNRASNDLVVISGVPYVVPIVLALLVAGTYVLNRTKYGRHLYAVGGNKEAARRAGINVPKLRTSVFVISSSFAAIGAIVYSSKVGSVSGQSGGLNTLLFAVGAAVIGGTSLFGGKGRIMDAVIGGAVLAIVNNGLGLLQQKAAVVNIITGLVLLLAATVDALSRRRAEASAR
ncbi:sugar ABC transporter permease [Amycolatopsis echigonensis]|uniref:Xylose transport system permease protein XylH n=1 Tax=Amycolatopsis echigonensis TaxID=2576905 RepID=A0A8E1VTW9_9PSEU|nr:ABC transporter permease [Amycolatopsis echigonensis]MBB2498193.1 ABC transporter permease [Amycolatopsis echigonensis]